MGHLTLEGAMTSQVENCCTSGKVVACLVLMFYPLLVSQSKYKNTVKRANDEPDMIVYTPVIPAFRILRQENHD